MANVNLIYFGSVTDITGIRSEKADAPATLNDLNDWLVARFPGLSALTYRFSVNRQLVNGDRQLADGDEIALLPPFAGG
jgi:molybdopterin synthase sulfur carrier subunit